MKLNQIGSNQTVITLSNGNSVFFSYQTPVAACVDGVFYATSKKWSRTTSKHVNAWLSGVDNVVVKEQEYFDNLVN